MIDYPLADSESELNIGKVRYSLINFPNYRYIPGIHPHPINSPEGHSFGAEEPEIDSWDSDEWAENEDYLFGVDLYNYHYYWEAHEAWEGLWTSAVRNSSEHRFLHDKIKLLNLKESLLKRPVNEGFSGGEKKRNEIFQMAVLEPKLALLDETDSGLDIDALRVVSNGVNAMRNKENATIVVTHYQRLLNYIIPDFVHVLVDGKIIRSGDKNLAIELEEKGYDKIIEGTKT